MKEKFSRLLRWSERYTKTDMIYLANAGWWLNLSVIVSSVLGLFLSIAFANLLTPEAYGLYQYLLSLSVLIAAISLAGMNSAVAQASARGYEGVLREAVRIQFKWMIVPFIIATTAAVYYLANGNVSLGIGLFAIAIFTPLGNTFNTYVGLLEGKRDFRRLFTLGTIVTVISYASLFLALIWVRNGVVLVVINFVANALAMAYAYYRTLALHKPNDRIDPKAITYGKHLSVMAAFTTALNQLGSVLIFHLLGAAELAVYGLATLLPERAGSLFTFVGSASMPKFANQPLAYIQKHLRGKLIRIVFVALAAALAYALAAPLLFEFFFRRYPSAIPFSMAYAPIIVLVAIASVMNAALTAKRLTREIYILNLVQPIVLVGLQIPLTLIYGLVGMIGAKLIASTIGVTLGLFFVFKPLQVQPGERASNESRETAETEE